MTKKTTAKTTPSAATTKKTPAKKAPAKRASKSSTTRKATSKKTADSPGGVAMAVVRNQAKDRKPKRVSGLDLAAKVLADAGEPLNAKTIAERAIAAGWKTSGKTPEATLYAAMIREIAKKGDAARFKKADRGLFASTAKGA